MENAPVISFSKVSKRYPGGYEALCGVSLEIAVGEIVFVTGQSGAGKSTLLKLLAGMERASSGTVLVGGQNVSAMRRAAKPYLRRNLGLVFQDHKLLYDRNVFDNVMLPLQVTGQSTKDSSRRARAALDKVGLLDREKANPISLSGGEQQRLCIARAVVNRPNIILADEPTASLDPQTARSIMEILRSFNQVGVTVLVATHDQAAVDHLRPRVLLLSKGRLA
ncbi:MAG: cell division ATP-binding protein FtsE [Betaproteobacteria bacterium]|nr:cell division ATP-binding protein FtsE [Betaproteobacteria bacterium]